MNSTCRKMIHRRMMDWRFHFMWCGIVVNDFIFISFLKIREPLYILYLIRQFLVLMIEKLMCERKLGSSINQKVDQ